MTRINTNVSSLIAQNTLGKSQADLQQSLTRLSTGLRINTGKDDPAGLIASENLRSDITSITKAISNTDRANEVIATADSGLAQVSSLLNDIRGLVTEAANSGAAGADQIAANQLQLDQSLKALNQISQTVTFQGASCSMAAWTSSPAAARTSTSSAVCRLIRRTWVRPASWQWTFRLRRLPRRPARTITGITASTDAANATTTLSLTNSAAQGDGYDHHGLNEQRFIHDYREARRCRCWHRRQTVRSNLVIVDGASEGASYNAGTHTLTATIDITGGSDTVSHLASVINAGPISRPLV